jgi:integrase
LNLFGETLATEFTLEHLEAVREEMIRRKWSRNYVNKSVNRVKRMFKWATPKYVSPAVSGAVAALKGLEAYRSEARETSKVEAVSDDVVEATLAMLLPKTADMVRVARLCGCRPGELIDINVEEIDRRDPECWFYRPRHHKNAHRNHVRSIPINEDAQAIHAPYIAKAGGGKLFHFKHRDGLRQAIERACKRAFPHPELSAMPKKKLTPTQRAELKAWHKAHRWFPNQLRHSAMQEATDKDGLEGAAALGSHRHMSTTEIYVRATEQRAKQAARKIKPGTVAQATG